MSGARNRRTMKVQIPAVNMRLLRGRDEELDENQSSLEKRRERIRNNELESEELQGEARVIRERRAVDQLSRGEENHQEPGTNLGDRLMTEVILPLVSDRLRGPQPGTGDTALATASINLARKALEKRGTAPPAAAKDPLDAMSKVIEVINQVRGMSNDDAVIKRLDKLETDLKEAPGKKSELGTLEETLTTITKYKDLLGITSGGGGDNSLKLQEMRNDQRQWEREFLSTEKTKDRAFNLRLRQIDKRQDIELAKLNIQKERNALLDSGLSRLGDTFITALLDDEDLEDTGLKGKKIEGSGLMQIPCPGEGCDTVLTIPPEGQAPGSEIRCPVCKGKFVTYEKD